MLGVNKSISSFQWKYPFGCRPLELKKVVYKLSVPTSVCCIYCRSVDPKLAQTNKK